MDIRKVISNLGLEYNDKEVSGLIIAKGEQAKLEKLKGKLDELEYSNDTEVASFLFDIPYTKGVIKEILITSYSDNHGYMMLSCERESISA